MLYVGGTHCKHTRYTETRTAEKSEKVFTHRLLKYARTPRSIIPRTLRLHESKQQTRSEGDTHDAPASHLNLLVGDTHAYIPHQMSEAVEAVESEWKADDELGKEFGDNRPRAKSSSDAGALNVPTESWCDKI